MTTWWLLVLSGFLGSSHCIGMCGGFAVMIGMNTGSPLRNFWSQLTYSAGRLMSYVTLGAIAAFAGRQTVSVFPGILNIPAVLSILSGLYLVHEGIVGLGYRIRALNGPSATGCLLRPLFSAVFRHPGLRNAFVAGIFTGLLPCGLVYAFVSLAASSGDLAQGMLTMGAFGLGTVPLMIFTGTSASLVGWSVRQRLMKVAAVSVIATGLLTLGRGAAFLQTGDGSGHQSCPFCAKKDSSSVLPIVSRRTGP